MDHITVEEAKNKLADLIRSATKDNLQYRITSEEGNVVVLPEETYDNILVTLELLSTPGLMDSVNFQKLLDEEMDAECISHSPHHQIV